MNKALAYVLLIFFMFSIFPPAEGAAEEIVPTVTLLTSPTGWEIVERFTSTTTLWTDDSANNYNGRTFYNNAASVTNCSALLLDSVFIRTRSTNVNADMGVGLDINAALASIQINHPADIYVAACTGTWSGNPIENEAKPLSDNYLPWLKEGFALPLGGYKKVYVGKNSETGADIPAVIHSSHGQFIHLYKKTVDVLEGETATVQFGGRAQTYSPMYNVFIVWKKVYQASVSTVGNGSVEGSGGGQVTPGENIRMLSGEETTFSVKPDNGNYIDYIKLNGETVLEDYLGEYPLTFVPEKDAVINVAFSNEYDIKNNITQRMKSDPSTGSIIQSVTAFGTLPLMLKNKDVEISVKSKSGAVTTLDTTADENGAYSVEFKLSEPGDYTLDLSVTFSPGVKNKLLDGSFNIVSPEPMNDLLTNLNSTNKISAGEFAERIIANSREYNFETDLFELLSAEQQNKICESILALSGLTVDTLTESYENHLLYGSFSYNSSGAVMVKTVDRYASDVGIEGSDLYTYYVALSDAQKAEAVSSMLNKVYTEKDALKAGFEESIVYYKFKSASLQGQIMPIITENPTLFDSTLVKNFEDNYTPARQTAVLIYLINKKASIKDFSALKNEVIYAINNVTETDKDKDGGGGGGGGGTNTSSSTASPGTTVPVVVSGDIKGNAPADVRIAPFSDISEGFWASEAIGYLYTAGIINGKSDGEFRPEELVTRAEFIKMLAELYSLTDENAVCDFTDVDKGHWAYKYIAGGYAAKIINGTSENTFAPDEGISREDMSVIIHRLLEQGKQLPEIEPTDFAFEDYNSISPYALDSVNILTAYGIIKGFSDDTFRPKQMVTRAEASQIIYNTSTNQYVNSKYYAGLIEKKYSASIDPTDRWWERTVTEYVQGEMEAQYIPRPQYVPAPEDISVIYKGELLNFDVKPIMAEGRVMMPLRSAFGIFDMDVEWDQDASAATCRNEAYTVVVTEGVGTAMVNGVEVTLDVPPFIVDGRLFVPLRFIGEAVGAHVDWDGNKKAVVID